MKVRDVFPPMAMAVTPNALAIVGAEVGAVTDKLADAVLPVPPFVEVTAPVVFVY